MNFFNKTFKYVLDKNMNAGQVWKILRSKFVQTAHKNSGFVRSFPGLASDYIQKQQVLRTYGTTTSSAGEVLSLTQLTYEVETQFCPK